MLNEKILNIPPVELSGTNTARSPKQIFAIQQGEKK